MIGGMPVSRPADCAPIGIFENMGTVQCISVPA